MCHKNPSQLGLQLQLLLCHQPYQFAISLGLMIYAQNELADQYTFFAGAVEGPHSRVCECARQRNFLAADVCKIGFKHIPCKAPISRENLEPILISTAGGMPSKSDMKSASE